MADIDLIPNDYRYWLWQLRLLKKFAVALVLLAVFYLAGYSVVTMLSSNMKNEFMLLQKNKAITTGQRNKLQQSNNEKNDLGRQWGLLNGLRGGTTIQDIFVVIDRAINSDELWFVDWQFSRAGVAVDSKQKESDTGYFIIVSDSGKKEETWEIQTHIKIKGQALNHVALSGFVDRLLNQPEIFDVRIVQTTLKRSAAADVVAFDLAVNVKNLRSTK